MNKIILLLLGAGMGISGVILTAGPQDILGHKTFPQGISTGFIDGGSSLTVKCAQTELTGALYAVGSTTAGAYRVAYGGSGIIALECEGAGNFCYIPLKSHNTSPALHGALTVLNATYMDGGILLQLKNPKGASGNEDTEFYVDAFGTFGSTYPYELAALPCPDPTAPVNTFGRGAFVGGMRFVQSDSHYYVCTGSGWKKIMLEGD